MKWYEAVFLGLVPFLTRMALRIFFPNLLPKRSREAGDPQDETPAEFKERIRKSEAERAAKAAKSGKSS